MKIVKTCTQIWCIFTQDGLKFEKEIYLLCKIFDALYYFKISLAVTFEYNFWHTVSNNIQVK